MKNDEIGLEINNSPKIEKIGENGENTNAGWNFTFLAKIAKIT